MPQLGILPQPASIASMDIIGSVDPSGPPVASSATPSLLTGVGVQPGLSISLALRPVPARIVTQIQIKEFVDMRELLVDNVALRSQPNDVRDSLGASVVSLAARPRVREVSSIPSWICCFLTFLAVGTTDAAMRDRLAYATLVLREAMRQVG